MSVPSTPPDLVSTKFMQHVRSMFSVHRKFFNEKLKGYTISFARVDLAERESAVVFALPCSVERPDPSFASITYHDDGKSMRHCFLDLLAGES